MKKIISSLAAIFLLGTMLFASEAPDSVSAKRRFKSSVVLHKSEKVVGVSIMYFNLGSNNSTFFLLAKNLGADANIFRVAPSFSYAYRDNGCIGIRGYYMNVAANLQNVNLNLLSDELKLDLSDFSGSANTFGVSIFNRNYFGFEPSGTVGLFLEERLTYSSSRMSFDKNNPGVYGTSGQIRLSFAPGIILYVLPYVSVQACIDIAGIGYTGASSFKDEVKTGSASQFNGSVSLSPMDINFGINFHF